MKKILIVSVVLILFDLGYIIYAGIKIYNEIGKEISEEIINPILVDLPTVVNLYYEEKSKWPSNVEELSSFALEHELTLNLDKFKSLSFLSKPNGNLAIEFTTYKDSIHSKGTTTADKITGQGTLEFSASTEK